MLYIFVCKRMTRTVPRHTAAHRINIQSALGPAHLICNVIPSVIMVLSLAFEAACKNYAVNPISIRTPSPPYRL